MRSPSPVPHGGRRSPNQYALRPSYTYEQYPTPTGHSPFEEARHRRLSDQYIPPPPQPSRHQQYHEPPQHAFQPPPSHHLHRRHSPQEYREPPSPPLRTLPPEYHAQRASAHPSFYHPQGYFDINDRSRSLSSVSIRDRRPEPVDVNAPGQNRRLAHLMSEQKRRESINTGFAALRTALPNSVPTDSKAIILRKAVSHISHLESLLRKAGINSSSGSAAPVLTPSSWDEDGDRVDGVEGDVGIEDDGDVEMDKGKWEDEEDDEEKQGRMPAGKGKVRQ
ncbi:hypothetical protein DB88DRAFT_511561 [Papiliotrema laurentii]|uniref:BHLH domain-containing protein n=1 Tax=Papiliotrema laurentii TaxID=5418 RepID=A0AAD9FKT3_PAPLA|nr:hypothetical protein DB88DRAFT_511561 [Papiliotrema laurentii]